MATVAVQITDAGASAPSYPDIQQELKIMYWGIYGADAILDDDSQDGQFIAALAQAIFDSNQVAITIYNAFSPGSAIGVQLSSLVKINGLRRFVSTNSEATVTCVGVAGTQIQNGVVGDNLGLGTKWALPTLVIIPVSGTVDVTATCTDTGAIPAAAASLTNILTPTLGWQTVNNASDAVAGQPVEKDSQLRIRQAKSTALPSMTILEGIFAAVDAVTGVQRLKVYENDGDVPDANGLLSHTTAVVVSGGDVTQIAQAIALKKAPGPGTFGTTSVVVVDRNGVPNTIKFFPLTIVQLKVQITIHPLPGYVSTTGDQLKQDTVDFINGFDIGEDSYTTRLYSPANQMGVGLGSTFVVLSIQQARLANGLSVNDVVIAFNEGATIIINNVTLVIA